MADSVVNILFKLRDETSRSLDKINQSVNDVQKGIEKANNSPLDSLAAGFTRVNNAVTVATDSINGLINEARKASLIFAAQGAALAAPFLIGSRAAGQFQTAVFEVGTLVDDSVQNNAQLTQSIVALSTQFGADRTEVASALYQAISSGARAGRDANDLLAVALQTARGGVTDVRTAVDGLTTILNAFNLRTSEASDVADSLFTTVRGGRTTIEELSRSLFLAAPLASQLGVKFTDLNAVLQVVTLQGTPTSVAAAQIRAALTSLLNDTDLVTKALGEFASAQEAIKELGLVAVLRRLEAAAEGSTSELRKGVGSVEALNLVLSVTGDNTERVNAALEDQENRLGATAAAAREVEQSFGVQLEIAGNRLSNVFERLGSTVLPILSTALNVFSDIFRRFTIILTDSVVARTIARIVFVMGLLITTLGILGATIITVSKIWLVNAVFSAGAKGMASIFARISAGAKLATASIAKIGPAGTVAAAGLTRAGVATTRFGRALFGLRAALGPISLVLTAISIAALAFADDFDEAKLSTDEFKEAIESFTIAQRVLKLSELRDEARETARELAAQTEKVNDLRDTIENGGKFSQIRARLQIEGAEEELAELEAKVEQTAEDISFFETNIGNLDVDKISDRELLELQENFVEVTAKAEEARQKLAEFAQQAQEPVEANLRTFQTREGPLTIGEEAQERGDVTDEEQEGIAELAAAYADLQGQADSYRIALERIRDVNKDREDEAAARAAEEAARKAAIAEQEAASGYASRLRAEERLRQEQAQAELEDILGLNDAARDAAEQRFSEQEISATDYYAELARLEQADADAKAANVQAQIAALAAQRQAAIDTANARALLSDPTGGGASADQLATINAQFDAQEVALNARLAQFQRSLQQRLADIDADLSKAGVAGVKAAIDDIVEQFDVAQQAIDARRQAGLISQEQAASETVALQGTVNRALEDTLTRLLEIKAAGFGGPELDAQIQRVTNLMQSTNQQLSVFAQRLKTSVEGSLADFFEETFKNLDNVGEAFDQLMLSIRDSIRRLIAEKFAEKLINSLFGKGSVLGGFFSSEGGQVGATGGLVSSTGGRVAKTGGLVAAMGGLVGPTPAVSSPGSFRSSLRQWVGLEYGASPDLPELGTPETVTARVQTPDLDAPKLATPEFEVPKLDVPEPDVPDLATPEMDVPKLDVPQPDPVKVPVQLIGQKDVPELDVPDTVSTHRRLHKENRERTLSAHRKQVEEALSSSEDVSRSEEAHASYERGVEAFAKSVQKQQKSADSVESTRVSRRISDVARSIRRFFGIKKAEDSVASHAESMERSERFDSVSTKVDKGRKLAKGGPVLEEEEEPRTRYQKAAGGGVAKRMSIGGGTVRGPGTSTSDDVGPLWLSAGEYVVRAAAVRKYGTDMLEAINRGVAPKIETRHFTVSRPRKVRFAEGGQVGPPNVGDITQSFSTQVTSGQAAGPSSMKLEVSEGALNMTMRDFLEREFGNIIATR